MVSDHGPPRTSDVVLVLGRRPDRRKQKDLAVEIIEAEIWSAQHEVLLEAASLVLSGEAIAIARQLRERAERSSHGVVGMSKKRPGTHGTKGSRPSWRIKCTGLQCQTVTVTVDSFEAESADKERVFRRALNELTRWLGSLDPVELGRVSKVVREEINRRPPRTHLLE